MCGHCAKKKELVINEGSIDISYALLACNTTHLESLGKRLIQTIESQPKLACFHVLPIHNKTCKIQCLNFGIPIFQQISKIYWKEMSWSKLTIHLGLFPYTISQ